VAEVAALEFSPQEAESGAMEHVEAPEPTSAGKRGPKLSDTWQRRSSPQQGDEVQSRGTHDSDGADLDREARFSAVRHVAAPDPTSTERCDPKL
jgi:hypothetical protein